MIFKVLDDGALANFNLEGRRITKKQTKCQI